MCIGQIKLILLCGFISLIIALVCLFAIVFYENTSIEGFKDFKRKKK